MSSAIIRRFLPAAQSGITVERNPAAAGEFKLRGYAAVFNSLSEDLGDFKEIIKPGAFAKHLATKPDIVALFNHDANHLLGRTTSGTLRVWEDATGLGYEVTLSDVSVAHRDLYALVKRGDVSASSFAFRVVQDQWTRERGYDLRRLQEVTVHDVSPVVSPAYAAATVGARTTAPLPSAPAARLTARQWQLKLKTY